MEDVINPLPGYPDVAVEARGQFITLSRGQRRQSIDTHGMTQDEVVRAMSVAARLLSMNRKQRRQVLYNG